MLLRLTLQAAWTRNIVKLIHYLLCSSDNVSNNHQSTLMSITGNLLISTLSCFSQLKTIIWETIIKDIADPIKFIYFCFLYWTYLPLILCQPDGPLIKFPKHTSNVQHLIIFLVTIRCIDDTPEPNTAESSWRESSCS